MTRPPDLTWIGQAACREEPSRRFVDPADHAEIRAALSVCQRCPVRDPCLETALNHRVEADVGIWGGTTPSQRRQIRRDRLQPEALRNGNGRRAPAPPPDSSRETPPARTGRPTEVRRLAAPEITVARDKYGDNGRREPASLPDSSRETPPARTRQPTEVRRLAAPEITVARDEYGDYASADGRVLIFRIRGALPWVLAIDDQIIGASRTVTEARRTAWTTLHKAERTDGRTPGPALARAHGGRR